MPLSLDLKGAQSDQLRLVRYLILRTLKILKNSTLSEEYDSIFLAHNRDFKNTKHVKAATFRRLQSNKFSILGPFPNRSAHI
mgnify:CR=1 FL=1